MDLYDEYGPEFMMLLEEDLSGALPRTNNAHQSPSTTPTVPKPSVQPQPPSTCLNLLNAANDQNPAIPINTHYVEITDDHRALAEELEKYTCPPLDLLDKGANAFLTLVTGVQWGEPYRRRKAFEFTDEDEEEIAEFPREELFTYDGESDSEKAKKKRNERTTVRSGPVRDERSPKQLNRLFPLHGMGESPFLKRMKMIKTNCANVVFMEHLEAMNERVEALERQLTLTLSQVPPAPEILQSQFAKPSNPAPIPAKTSESPTSSKSDDFEVVTPSGKSITELEAALAEAQKQIAEADKRSDQFAEKYNNLVASMSEAMMNAARFANPSPPAPIADKTSSSSSKSDDFEVVGESGKSLAEAQRLIAEADKRSDQFAEKYNNLVASMSEAMMNAAR